MELPQYIHSKFGRKYKFVIYRSINFNGKAPGYFEKLLMFLPHFLNCFKQRMLTVDLLFFLCGFSYFDVKLTTDLLV